MRVETCMNIVELNTRDFIREIYEGNLEDCLNWKRVKIYEFFDLVGFDTPIESIGYNTLVFGSKLLENKNDVMLCCDTRAANFLTVYFYGD